MFAVLKFVFIVVICCACFAGCGDDNGVPSQDLPTNSTGNSSTDSSPTNTSPGRETPETPPGNPGTSVTPSDTPDTPSEMPSETGREAHELTDGVSLLNPLDVQGDIVQDHFLNSGDCFNRGVVERDGREVTLTTRVDCDTPHVYEVFHTFDLKVAHPAVYPGEEVMRSYARRLCYEHFEPFVGETYERSIYEIGVFIPLRANFEHDKARYRGVHCWLYIDDDEPVLMSARGTAV